MKLRIRRFVAGLLCASTLPFGSVGTLSATAGPLAAAAEGEVDESVRELFEEQRDTAGAAWQDVGLLAGTLASEVGIVDTRSNTTTRPNAGTAANRRKNAIGPVPQVTAFPLPVSPLVQNKSQVQLLPAPPAPSRLNLASAGTPVPMVLPSLMPRVAKRLALHAVPSVNPLAKIMKDFAPLPSSLPPDPKAMSSAIRMHRRGTLALSSGRKTDANIPVGPPAISYGAPNFSGINRWWTYEEGTIPGAGKWMVNDGTGNLLLQDDDFDVHEASVDLALRRNYNSSLVSDTTAMFGNGWTSTFTAHMVKNSGNGVNDGLSIYDIDGARYDYLPDGNGGWTPPPE